MRRETEKRGGNSWKGGKQEKTYNTELLENCLYDSIKLLEFGL